MFVENIKIKGLIKVGIVTDYQFIAFAEPLYGGAIYLNGNIIIIGSCFYITAMFWFSYFSV